MQNYVSVEQHERELQRSAVSFVSRCNKIALETKTSLQRVFVTIAFRLYIVILKDNYLAKNFTVIFWYGWFTHMN